MRNLSLGRRHLVNAHEVKVGIGVIAGNTEWSMPERLECEVLQKARYINTLTFTFTFYIAVALIAENKWSLRYKIDGAKFTSLDEFHLNSIATMPYPSNHILIWGTVLFHR